MLHNLLGKATYSPFSQQTCWGVTAGKAQVLPITLTMLPVIRWNQPYFLHFHICFYFVPPKVKLPNKNDKTSHKSSQTRLLWTHSDSSHSEICTCSPAASHFRQSSLVSFYPGCSLSLTKTYQRHIRVICYKLVSCLLDVRYVPVLV